MNVKDDQGQILLAYTGFIFCMWRGYYNNLKFWGRQARGKSVDPDQMMQNEESDQGLHCLTLVQFNTSTDNRIDLFKS